jgi:hypothetical protein
VDIFGLDWRAAVAVAVVVAGAGAGTQWWCWWEMDRIIAGIALVSRWAQALTFLNGG